jgi:hypothetical protein
MVHFREDKIIDLLCRAAIALYHIAVLDREATPGALSKKKEAKN